MGTFSRFEDIEAWQQGRGLTAMIYRISKEGPFSRDYALRDQMRRSAISITSNIAEGFERNSNPAFIHFLNIAKGSTGEVRSQLYVALDEGYISQEDFDRLYELSNAVSNKIGGLTRYLERITQSQ